MHKNFAKTLFLGKNVIYLPECHSTNEFAAEIVNKESIVEGSIVITDKQTRGKGQRGNKWNAQPGQNLTFTLILRPHFVRISEQFNMTMVISLALADVFNRYLEMEKVSIKWPNDLYVDEQKCAGILIENGIKSNQIDYMLVGIGINVNQKEFGLPSASSLSNFYGSDLNLGDVLESTLLSIEKYYLQLKNSGLIKLRPLYLENLLWKDKWHLFRDSTGLFNGKIIGVDPIGRLVIQTQEGQKCYHIKEVSFEK